MNRFILAFKYIRKNIKNIFIFEIIYKVFTLAVFTPVILELVQVALRLAGINYLTNKRFLGFITEPTSVAVLGIVILIFALFCVVEMGAMIYCYQVTQSGEKATVTNMLKAGLQAAVRLFLPANFLMMFLIIAMIPITHAGMVSTYLSSVQIPLFVVEFIKIKKLPLMVLVIIVIVSVVFAVRWMNSLCYYVMEKMSFIRAAKASARLNKKHYPMFVVGMALWQLIAVIMLVLSFSGVTFLLTMGIKLFVKGKSAYNTSLYIARLLYKVWQLLYFIIIVPWTCAYMSGYFFERKSKINEEIVIPVVPKKKSVGSSKFNKIVSLVIVLSFVLNIIYICYDFRIFGTVSKVQLLKDTDIAAHRGYSSEAPENTIPAFEASIDNFADYVELDVQQTKDGEIVVMHDTNLKRTTGLNKKIWNVTYEELSELDAGSWFSEEFAETRVPKLSEVMEIAKGNLKLNIEIKLKGKEDHLVEKVVDIINEYDMRDSCVITSFQPKALKRVKDHDSRVKTGYILNVAYGDFSNISYADALSINYAFATESLVNMAHDSGKEVYVWTVNTPEAINDMLELGVDMIITDDPVLVRETVTSYETTPFLVKLIKFFMEI